MARERGKKAERGWMDGEGGKGCREEESERKKATRRERKQERKF